MSLLAGKSVTTCSRTQPPGKSLVLESEKLHLRFGTTPLSVPWAPRLSGFCRSSGLFVPPKWKVLASLASWLHISSFWQWKNDQLPRMGPPLPFALIGWPCVNC